MFSGVSTGGKLELRGIAEFRRSYHPEPMRNLDFSLSSKMKPEEVGWELASSNSDGTAAVRRGIWNDTASDKNGNCHFAELG